MQIGGIQVIRTSTKKPDDYNSDNSLCHVYREHCEGSLGIHAISRDLHFIPIVDIGEQIWEGNPTHVGA